MGVAGQHVPEKLWLNSDIVVPLEGQILGGISKFKLQSKELLKMFRNFYLELINISSVSVLNLVFLISAIFSILCFVYLHMLIIFKEHSIDHHINYVWPHIWNMICIWV